MNESEETNRLLVALLEETRAIRALLEELASSYEVEEQITVVDAPPSIGERLEQAHQRFQDNVRRRR